MRRKRRRRRRERNDEKLSEKGKYSEQAAFCKQACVTKYAVLLSSPSYPLTLPDSAHNATAGLPHKKQPPKLFLSSKITLSYILEELSCGRSGGYLLMHTSEDLGLGNSIPCHEAEKGMGNI